MTAASARLSDLLHWRADLVKNLAGDILEIGVGKGENLGHYRKAEHLWAIEPDAERAEAARQTGKASGLDVAIQVAPAEALPYANDSFDHVVSSLVFCSVADQRRALVEISRVLRPSGVLHMVEHVRPRNQYLAALLSAITPWWRRIAYNCHLDRPTIELLRRSGWRVEIHRRFGLFIRLSATYEPGF